MGDSNNAMSAWSWSGQNGLEGCYGIAWSTSYMHGYPGCASVQGFFRDWNLESDAAVHTAYANKGFKWPKLGCKL